MTSMIDVVFLLLIFFVCASVGMTQEDLLSTLLSGGDTPSSTEVVEEDLLDDVWIKIWIDDDGECVTEMNDRVYPEFDDLRNTLLRLAEAAPEIPVILDIASEVTMGDVIRLYDTCQEANFHVIQFAVHPAVAPPKKLVPIN
ncbi:MAG: biopolymer transporter ExbD [Planctomycetota bacterium]|nr:biopolymer transporter ExbD [Planctomycetota bacterium]MDA1214346.1 biopolymer transporter ExbD [Planctomycetota bacterium]